MPPRGPGRPARPPPDPRGVPCRPPAAGVSARSSPALRSPALPSSWSRSRPGQPCRRWTASHERRLSGRRQRDALHRPGVRCLHRALAEDDDRVAGVAIRRRRRVHRRRRPQLPAASADRVLGSRGLRPWLAAAAGLQGPAGALRRQRRPEDQARAGGKRGDVRRGEAVAAAKVLGLTGGSAIYDDMEYYTPGVASCRTAVLFFLSGWTVRLHQLGYVAGSMSSSPLAPATWPGSMPRRHTHGPMRCGSHATTATQR